ncbi:MAG TPA: SPFH domain-containing protein [Candidatus Sulfotelmatobacter sp.]|nr:SPFH domain-containing protein [Candidatus Sulfotelmatobacter sp.]
MLALKFLLMILGVGLFGSAAVVVAYDVYVAARLRWLLEQSGAQGGAEGITSIQRRPFGPVRWELARNLVLAGILPVLLALSIAVVPDGFAGIRVSQFSGVRPGTLYPGVHFLTPFIDQIILYDTREQVYTTAASAGGKTPAEVLTVQAREGLNIGLAVSVRYRLDPSRLSSIHQNLPQPVGDQVVGPVVSATYRQLAPNYVTREIFAVKREELRSQAAEAIKTRLASDGIIVREVLLRDIQLPAEYAKGLEGLLLKEQENERLGTEQEIKQKEVKIAELEAEAQKSREVKQAEAQAQVRVLQAKGESDAMQYTLPLKQKQIEQSKLEAAARKEATLQNAEAAAQAKIIDSKAEVERQKNLADAEANRIRVTAAADAERMKYEATVLKQNPMLIQKIIAERLSDKLQIMMVPMDGKNFFAADVMRSAFQNSGATASPNAPDTQDDEEDPSPTTTAAAQRKPAKRR